MQNNNLEPDKLIENARLRIFEVFLDFGLIPGSETDRETAKLILIRAMHSLLLETGQQPTPEKLKSHFDDYFSMMAALAIPEHELQQAGLLPKPGGLN